MSQSMAGFDALVQAISQVHRQLQDRTAHAVNTALTLRNWLIGEHIHLYEFDGQDRAEYGSQLFDRLAQQLAQHGVPRTDARELRRYRLFYLTYPYIWETVSPGLAQQLALHDWRAKNQETLSPTFPEGPNLIERLSFSHFVELLSLEDEAKRQFYERHAFAEQWSVRQLRRQITSLLYERTALSVNANAAIREAKNVDTIAAYADVIRDPYVFEFLGLKSTEVMGESRLEDALLDKVQTFLIEMGRGFCFEARQKRLSIGGEYFFVDLVFYHRLLKCHVLVELKVDEFRHEHLGQLNTYVNWYRKHEMTETDNPPIGLLLCTRKNHALVEYALAGMDNHLFVSKYQLALPAKEELERYVDAQIVGGIEGR